MQIRKNSHYPPFPYFQAFQYSVILVLIMSNLFESLININIDTHISPNKAEAIRLFELAIFKTTYTSKPKNSIVKIAKKYL